MSITKELREWAYSSTTNEVLLSNPPRHVVHGVLETLIGIADRIDAEHEAKESYWQAESYKDGYDEGFASADDALSREESGMLAEHGFIRLPKDADGEYIHIGDVMAYADNTKPMKVIALIPPAVIHTEEGPRYADMCRHYHAPTVEDVLRKLVGKAQMLSCVDDEDKLVADFAKRLRLVGEDQ